MRRRRDAALLMNLASFMRDPNRGILRWAKRRLPAKAGRTTVQGRVAEPQVLECSATGSPLDHFFGRRIMSPIYMAHERARVQAFEDIWSNDIDDVFSDVAKYYD